MRNGDERKSILLVIEPDSATRSGMKRLLEEGTGFTVTAVRDENEAALVAGRLTYDLILFDSDLPPPASYVLAHSIHQRAALRSTPLLVISVHGKSKFGEHHLDADKFSVAYISELSRFDELETLIDFMLKLKK